jgi:hypothetical protein
VLIETLMGVLAGFGLGALLLRLLGALFGLGLTAVEASHASNVSEASARRGDITAMMEGRETAAAMQRRRLRSAAWVGLWAAVLVVPALFGVARYVYAAAALLWVMPGGRPRVQIRTGRGGP